MNTFGKFLTSIMLIMGIATLSFSETILVQKEIALGEKEEIKDKLDYLIKEAIKEAKQHSCALKARDEKREISVGVKVELVTDSEQQRKLIVRVVSDNC